MRSTDIFQTMTQKQLEDYLWGAANILRGMIDAADFKQYIFPLLFLNVLAIYGTKNINQRWKKAEMI
jgi:type I restriction-modification system DNA methylase subunit